MAGENGPPPGSVTLLEPLAERPEQFTLFAALRLLEQAFADQPRLGEARKASDDPVRLGQTPTLAFAPTQISTFKSEQDEPVRLEQYSFGVFGPNGAVPLHLTEGLHEHVEPSRTAGDLRSCEVARSGDRATTVRDCFYN